MISVCAISQPVTAAEASRTKPSAAPSAIRSPAYPITTNRASTASAPTRPSSSPMMAKMKSVCASGSWPHFSRLAPTPTPNQPPEESALKPCAAW